VNTPPRATIAPTSCVRRTFEVDLAALAENYARIAAHVAPARVMPILKANAYGHGLVEVGRVAERMGAPYIGVAYLEEALRLRQHACARPVLSSRHPAPRSAIPRARRHADRVVARQASRDRGACAQMGRMATVH